MQQDDDQQADMCELIRAGLFYDKFGPLQNYGKINKLNSNFLINLDCPGYGKVTQPCAYNDSKFWDMTLWTILYNSVGLRLKNLPTFLNTDSDKYKEK